MKKFLSMVAGATMSVGVLGALSSPAQAECGDLSLGAMGWDSGESISAVAEFLLTQGYGCNVTVVPTDTIPAVTSMAENGEPHIVPEVWQNSAPIYRELVEEGKVITAAKTFASGGEEGWWIPTYLVEKHPELATIEGVLANPELVGGRFHNCPVGWGCRIVNDALKKVHDLEGNGIEVFDHGSGANLSASIGAAFADEAPWFGYYWGPTAILGKYPMTRVDIGEVDIAQHTKNQNPDTPETELGVSAYPSAAVVTAISSEFAEANPDIYAFTQKMSFPNDVLNVMLAWKDDNGASADEAAAWFLSNHGDLAKSWVNAEARAKLDALF